MTAAPVPLAAPNVTASARRPLLGIARGGWRVVLTVEFLAVAITAGSVAILGPAGWLAAVATLPVALWCLWFFRDPERTPPADPDAIISAADGVVCGVGPASPPAELGLPAEPRTRVSVFMNIFNVHVNRAPAAGVVRRTAYRPGKFFNASFDKASDLNERLGLVLDPPGRGAPSRDARSDVAQDARAIAVVQIAGLVARRIISYTAEGASLARGERFGLIRFGSRVDVYLPVDASPEVRVGERVRAGVSVIARFTDQRFADNRLTDKEPDRGPPPLAR